VGQYNFKLEAATEEALKSSLELITHASLSRLSLELEKILKNPYGDLIFEAFYQHGFLYYFLPYLHKHWESDTGKYMRKLFALRNKHVREELYRDSISLAIATLALPFVERNIGGEHGALWDNYAGIEKIIRQVILKVIAPQNTTKRLMASALRALLLQPRFLNSKSKRIIYHPGYPHGRQLMIMQNELIWQDQELQEFWPERQHKRHLNNPNEAKPKRRRKYPKRKPDRRKPDLGMIEE
jgi:poly(A) polymerase